MKLVIGLMFAAALFTIDPATIKRINALKAEAKKAYHAGDYKKAATNYSLLIDSLDVSEEEVLMNLANALFHLNDTLNAIDRYQSLTASANATFKSKAYQQLGVLKTRQGGLEEALNQFKQSLKADPTNEDARYNYEMVKKKIAEEKEQQQNENEEEEEQQQDQPEEQEDNQEQEENEGDQNQQDSEGNEQQQNESGEEEQQDQPQESPENEEQESDEMSPSVAEKLEEMDISEEKAQMILEAMKNQEIQYLQQNERKATQSPDRTKPDW